MSGSKVTRLYGVQYLRGIAALMVAYYHLTKEQSLGAYLPWLSTDRILSTDRLALGVHIFFVVSGFIMLATTTTSRPADFCVRRLVRIVPLYWALTLALVALALLPPHFFHSTAITGPKLAMSLLFVPYSAFPLLTPGWTLNIEMFFYGLFALALFAPVRTRVWIVGGILLLLVGLGASLSQTTSSAALWTYTRPWMAEFVLGMVIARIYLAGTLRLPRAVCAGLILAGFAALMSAKVTIWPGWPSAAIVLGAVAYESAYGIKSRPWAALLGDASYSIYLSHIFVLGAIGVLWAHAGLSNPSTPRTVVLALLSMSLTTAVGIATYRFLEAPMLRLLRPARPGERRLRSSDTPLSAPANLPGSAN